MIRRVLIANRGEIAIRIARACRDLGIETVQAHSDEDRDSLAVQLASRAVNIGPTRASESYLNQAAILGAAMISECDAIHPGYGFLSENAAFARECARCGIVFIGPDADVIDKMGDKIAARTIARAAGVQTVPGSQAAIESATQARSLADEIGYPILLKAAAGGGGKGMRIVESEAGLGEAFTAAQSEALAAFGDPRLYLERYLADIRHVEVQVIGDATNVVHVGERDCTIQRRHQKLVEECPSPALDERLRDQITDAAVRLARMVGYRSLGTMEFVLDNRTREFYFIEMNTRLQVEHPVTEMVTGIDLVAEQIRIASGEVLSIQQQAVRMRGHAIECRINAEDPDRDFLPRAGTISEMRVPAGPWVRVDTHAVAGGRIPPFYDSLVAKIIAWGPTRDLAIARMRRALVEFDVRGITTNLAFHVSAMADSRFVDGRFNTGFVSSLVESGRKERIGHPAGAARRHGIPS